MRFMKPSGVSPSMIVALLALFVSLGGTGYAALRITGRDIVNGSIKNRDIANNAISSSKVANGSLRSVDFKGANLPDGPRGPAGPNGPRGPAGATKVTTRVGAPAMADPNGGVATASVDCDPGERATGGGGSANYGGPYLLDSIPTPDTSNAKPTGWQVTYRNNGTNPSTLTAYVVCAAP